MPKDHGRQPQGMRSLPSSVTKVIVGDDGSRVEKTEPMAWNLMPPAPHLCQVCAVDHDPLIPHNAQSMYYQVAFANAHGRTVTWADAQCHCSPELQAKWKKQLVALKAWSEPPEGVEPIAHLPPIKGAK